MELGSLKEITRKVIDAPINAVERLVGGLAAANAVMKLNTGLDATSPFSQREKQALEELGVLPPETPLDQVDQN